MPLLTWNEEFSVEVQAIDRQHQKLFQMMNELHDAMKVGNGSKLAPAILTRLVAYAREHFATEEALMKHARYPGLAAHRAEHDQLTQQVAKMVKDFADGNAAITTSLLDFLRNWLRSHILTRDKSYTAHLRAAGIH
jgi:hemerythrin-like metal-binding protein